MDGRCGDCLPGAVQARSAFGANYNEHYKDVDQQRLCAGDDQQESGRQRRRQYAWIDDFKALSEG